jgi:methionine synthase I (cobalamin-dependent)
MVDRVSLPLLNAMAERVLVADGAMGTMLQAQDLSLDDFAGLEGCNEILNVTRPDVVAAVHRGYLAAGADAVETNTFGANLANLAEYDIADRIRELSERGANLARAAADEFSAPDEQGQARTADHKVEIAQRLITDTTEKYGLAQSDIIVDTLTFTIATGQEESRSDALETIAAIRARKKAHPKVRTTLGLSNVSFGLNPAARQMLNSVFPHECVQAGLDTAIVHASKIVHHPAVRYFNA